jgi:ATP-binding cassette subfamily F protein 2
MFIQTKAELEVNQMKKYEKEQADIAHIKKFVASAGTYANLVKQAKSKLKIIEKMEEAGLTEKVEKDYVFKFAFPEAERLPPPVLALDHVSFAYSGLMKDCLYTDLNLGVDMDSRIALVGPNGAGKSTLLKLMLGEIPATQGDVKRHLHVNIARYNQHSNDQLDPEKTVLDFVRSNFPDRKWEEQEWRTQVGKYGIGGGLQTTKIGELSDGMKSRVVFCILSLKNPHLLLLDEPTNHLDMECIDSLAHAVNNFNGGLLLVSHDFRLISQVAKEIWICDNKTVTRFSGDIRAYKQLLVEKMKKASIAYDKANGLAKK